MLENLTHKERNAKIEAISKSDANKAYDMYFDYYNGIHFTYEYATSSDYGRTRQGSVKTRSGVSVFDRPTKDEKFPVKSNWCRPIVNTVADYTRGVDEDIVVTAKSKADEKKLREFWSKNHINTFTHETAYETGIFGHGWIKFTRNEGDEKINFVRPTNAYAVVGTYGDIESFIYYVKITKSQARARGVEIRGEEAWYFEEWTNTGVVKYVDGNVIEEGLNPYKQIPFILQKSDAYGTSDIHDVITLNDQLNITLTNIAEILKYHAFPVYAPKGSASTNDNFLTAEQVKSIEISPSSMLNFPIERIEGKGVDQSVLQHVDSIKKDITIVAGVPIKLLTAEMDGNLSGVALERMMSSVIKQAEIRRSYIREAYKSVNNLILGKEAETDVIFPDIMKADQEGELNAAMAKVSLGISKDTVFEELGYDYEDEKKKKESELEMTFETRLNQEIDGTNQDEQETGIETQSTNA